MSLAVTLAARNFHTANAFNITKLLATLTISSLQQNLNYFFLLFIIDSFSIFINNIKKTHWVLFSYFFKKLY